MTTRGIVTFNPLAQAIEHARHEYDHRDAFFARLVDDLRRVKRAMKVNFTAQKLRDKDAHELSEDVAQGHEIQEANRMNKSLPLDVFFDLNFERQKVGEQIAVREQHTLRRGRGTGCEDDFDERVFINLLDQVWVGGVVCNRLAQFIKREKRNVSAFTDSNAAARRDQLCVRLLLY